MEELFLPRTEFENYEDFFKNYKINVPENFNFSYDVMDVLASKSPDARAILWTNDEGLSKEFTFAEIKERTDKVASFFQASGINKGDLRSKEEIELCIKQYSASNPIRKDRKE